jgi:hypothetical protein
MFAKKRYGSSQLEFVRCIPWSKQGGFDLVVLNKSPAVLLEGKLWGVNLDSGGQSFKKTGQNLKKLCKNLGLGLHYHNVMRFCHNVCHYRKSFTIKMALVTILLFTIKTLP